MDKRDIEKLFDGVEIDENTTINLVDYREVEGLPVRLEHWTSDGIHALTYIFKTQDAAEKTDAELKAMVDQSKGVTLKRGDEFTYVNFGFLTD